MHPIATAVHSYPSMVGFQNNVEPQIEQKPRRTFSDDWYHLTDSAPRT